MWRAAGGGRNNANRPTPARPGGGARGRTADPARAPRPLATTLTVIPRVPKTLACPAIQFDSVALIAASTLPAGGFSGTTLMMEPPEHRLSPTACTVSTADSTVASSAVRHAVAVSEIE